MDNLDIIVGAVALASLGIGAIYGFVKLGKEKQMEKVKEWLIFTTIEAEKLLGSKTGQIKLRFVYDLFISKFKFVALLITFEEFSELVDEALIQMRHMIETNEAVANYVNK